MAKYHTLDHEPEFGQSGLPFMRGGHSEPVTAITGGPGDHGVGRGRLLRSGSLCSPALHKPPPAERELKGNISICGRQPPEGGGLICI